ncbi:MAG: ATP-grasp domain-containing protein [Caldilineaceae bacterium]|nr:ATP-grasp domain-containing protein [Caldilineaceae bacterium]
MSTQSNRPTILVTDTNRGSAISIIRSLGRRGWRVIAADSTPDSLGFRSRYVGETLLYPDAESEPRGLVNCLLDAVQRFGVDLVLPVTDAVILPLSAERARFEGICKLALPTPEALDVVTNKLKTLELAQELDVPAPKTKLVHTVKEALAYGAELGWPIVLKPQNSRLYRDQAAIESFTVCYAENEEQLARQMARFEGRCPVLLQEYYTGSGQGVELLMHEGRPLAAFQHKRLREVPINGGASAFRESVALDPALYAHSVRLLEALKWTGLAMVEFKVGEQGPKLMEINGRVWGSLPLAVRSGMDFPAGLVDLYLQGPPPATTPVNTDYKVGVRARNLELDIVWIASVLQGKQRYPFLKMPKRYEAVTAFFELFHPAYKFDILSRSDLMPGLAEIPKITRKLVAKFKDAA